jgi:hypothetical protein
MPLLAAHDVVTVSHAPAALGDALSRWSFSDRRNLTTLVDLRLPLDELRARLHRSCAYKIRRAERVEHELFVNERTDEARALLEDGIRRKRWRPAISDDEWEALRSTTDVFLATMHGRPTAARVVFRAGGRRAVMRMSAIVPTAPGTEGTLVGCVNRRLHWHEFEHYRAQGFDAYDFGGVVVDPRHVMYGIAQFKRSFGGDLVTERFLRLARNPLLRVLLRLGFRGDGRSPSMNAATTLAADRGLDEERKLDSTKRWLDAAHTGRDCAP